VAASPSTLAREQVWTNTQRDASITFADTETIEVEARLDITRGNMMVDGGISVVLKKPLLSGGTITVP
jgi:hypothetical protein